MQGLTTAEAEARHRAGRGNSDPARPSRTYAQVLRTNVFTLFNNVLLAIGAGLLALGRVNDAVISVGLALLNAVIGAVEELRAKRTLDRLRLLQRSPVRVLRDGTEVELPQDRVVEGDLLRLTAGDQVVVDGPLVGPGRLEVDESLLTGESEPVRKAEGDLLLSGSAVLTGQSLQRAEAVGGASHAARLTAAARTWTRTLTPLQARIDTVVRLLVLLVVLLSVLILLQALLEGLPLVRVVQISAVLSGLVPYGLFFLVTAAYATGAAALSHQGALVQQLNAVESLSNVDVLCTDKTGTLTSGRLQLRDVLPLVGAPDARAALGALAASVGAANATTRALAAALPAGPVPVVQEVPFSSARRWSGAVAPAHGGALVLGAADALLPALVAVPGDLDALVDAQARAGLRVLLLAAGAHPGARLLDEQGAPCLPPLRPLALVVLADELRPHAREALTALRGRGVAVKVVSGDDPRTVAALVAQLGLVDEAPVSGPELALLDPEELEEVVDARSVFGRVAPEQKEQLVGALQRRGHWVAMIGDGVNDTRSLKQADLGVAVQSGSSVARDVADLVLLDDDFSVLAPARVRGQRIIGGISTSLHLFLARVVGSMLAIAGVAVVGLGFPYEPAQVGLTLFSVGLPSLVLTAWAAPEEPDPRLLSRVGRFALTSGVVTALVAVGLYALFSTLVLNGLEAGLVPDDAVERFEAFTGLAGTDEEFAALAATGVAQTALSMFTTLTAFLLILFLLPPCRAFTGWVREVADDKRPAALAAGLLVAFLAVLLTPALADYFDLLRPDPPIAAAVVLVTLLWFFAVRAMWRHDLVERLLRLPRPGPGGPGAHGAGQALRSTAEVRRVSPPRT